MNYIENYPGIMRHTRCNGAALFCDLTTEELDARLTYYDCIGGEIMEVFEMAKNYYPRLWDKSRLEALVAAGRLTKSKMDEITGDTEEV